MGCGPASGPILKKALCRTSLVVGRRIYIYNIHDVSRFDVNMGSETRTEIRKYKSLYIYIYI